MALLRARCTLFYEISYITKTSTSPIWFDRVCALIVSKGSRCTQHDVLRRFRLRNGARRHKAFGQPDEIHDQPTLSSMGMKNSPVGLAPGMDAGEDDGAKVGLGVKDGEGVLLASQEGVGCTGVQPTSGVSE